MVIVMGTVKLDPDKLEGAKPAMVNMRMLKTCSTQQPCTSPSNGETAPR